MRKKVSARPLFAVCYGLAAALWVAYCVLQSATMLTYKLKGEMPVRTLTPQELKTESFERYDSNEWWQSPDERPDWYLSTSNDPHIFWQGRGYLRTVRLEVEHRLAPGAVALYYLTPGQTDYSESQKVYARVVDGGYEFDLGGRVVTGLRIDPDSLGGIPTYFTGVTLNPARLWLLDLVPDGGQWLLLLLAPAFAAALAGLFLENEK